MNRIDGITLQKALFNAYQELEKNKEIVNTLNVFPVPDGDTGTNMSLTMKSAMRQVRELDNPTVEQVGKALANGSLMGARGNSGVILSQLCRGFAQALVGKTTIGLEDIPALFTNARDMAYKAVMKPTEGTILSVARAMGEFAEKNEDQYEDMFVFLKDLLAEGNRMLQMTPEMLPMLKEAGVVDAGGQGLLTLLAGFVASASGDESVIDMSTAELGENKNMPTIEAIEDSEIEFGYCTEFFIRTDNPDFESFRSEIESMGDSIVCIGMDDVIKTHIHTNHPGEVLELALKRGYLMDIKIDNMRLQHQHRLSTDAEVNAAQTGHESTEETSAVDSEPAGKPVELKPYGFVAVSLGEGFDQIFKDLLVDEIVSGGQTMNPSTADLFEASERIDAETVFIFPNNKNIIMAADQVQSLSQKNIVVIPTRTIPEGFGSLLAFDESMSPEENAEAMKDAISMITTGQITYSIRDTELQGLKIENGALIGLLGGDIVATGSDQLTVLFELLDKGVTEESALISIYSGQDVTDEDAEEIADAVSKKYSDLEVDLQRGDQPTYYYIVSIE